MTKFDRNCVWFKPSTSNPWYYVKSKKTICRVSTENKNRWASARRGYCVVWLLLKAFYYQPQEFANKKNKICCENTKCLRFIHFDLTHCTILCPIFTLARFNRKCFIYLYGVSPSLIVWRVNFHFGFLLSLSFFVILTHSPFVIKEAYWDIPSKKIIP